MKVMPRAVNSARQKAPSVKSGCRMPRAPGDGPARQPPRTTSTTPMAAPTKASIRLSPSRRVDRSATGPADGPQQPELTGPFEQRQEHGVAHDDRTDEDGQHRAAVDGGLEVDKALIRPPELGGGPDGREFGWARSMWAGDGGDRGTRWTFTKARVTMPGTRL